MECFTVYADEIEGRVDPHFYISKFRELEEKLRELNHKQLREVIEFSSETWDQKNLFDNEFPYIEISEIDTASGEIQNMTYYKKTKAPSRARMIVRENDIIISTTRPHRGAITLIDKEKDGFIASTGFAILRKPKIEINKKYLLCFLRTQLSLNQLLQRGSGGNYPAITSEELKKLIVPIPKINVQNRIVQIMDNAYEIKKQKETQAKKLFDSINDYVLDELGIKFPELKDEMCYVVTADDVKNNRCDPYYYPPKFGKVEEAIKKGEYEIRELKDSFGNGLIKGILPKEKEKNGDFKVLQIKNIQRNGLMDIKEYITSKNIFKEEHKINEEDIIIVITGATIGKVGLWTSKEKFYLGGDMVKFKTNSDFIPHFIQAFLLSQVGQCQIIREITGATNKHLSPSDVETFKIPIPPLKIQNKIAEEIKARMQKAEQLKKEAETILKPAKAKVEAILLGEEKIEG